LKLNLFNSWLATVLIKFRTTTQGVHPSHKSVKSV